MQLGVLKVSTNDQSKENEYIYYTIAPLKYYALTRRPLVQTDGHFSVLEAERPENPDGMS